LFENTRKISSLPSFSFFIRLFMQITPQHLATIVERAERCGVRKVVLFGGALEHPHDTEDIDIAVDAPDFIAFAVDLDAHLSCSVDVVPIQRGTPFIEHILQKGRVLYAA
jgi:hypothetical protein